MGTVPAGALNERDDDDDRGIGDLGARVEGFHVSPGKPAPDVAPAAMPTPDQVRASRKGRKDQKRNK